jgi:hypothetical protein
MERTFSQVLTIEPRTQITTHRLPRTRISNVLVISPEGTIICDVNFPGSWHDAAVSRALGGMSVVQIDYA